MWHVRIQNGDKAQQRAYALESCAGIALACAYSSSEEFEAEVIRIRRAAGAYGAFVPRQLYAAVALGAATVIAFLTFQF